MKIALCSHYAENYTKLGVIMEKNRIDYCKNHNYELIIKKDDFYGKMGFGFSKIKFILDLCNKTDFDLIHWGGVDTLITNFNIKIEDWVDDFHSFFISKEESGQFKSINADTFIVKNNERGRFVLNFILSKFEEYKNHPWQEQQVMIDFLETDIFKGIIKIMPHQSFNSYPWKFYGPDQAGDSSVHRGEPGDFKNGDFLLHCPGHTLENRIRIFNHYLPLVIK